MIAPQITRAWPRTKWTITHGRHCKNRRPQNRCVAVRCPGTYKSQTRITCVGMDGRIRVRLHLIAAVAAAAAVATTATAGSVFPASGYWPYVAQQAAGAYEPMPRDPSLPDGFILVNRKPWHQVPPRVRSNNKSSAWNNRKKIVYTRKPTTTTEFQHRFMPRTKRPPVTDAVPSTTKARRTTWVRKTTKAPDTTQDTSPTSPLPNGD